MVLFPSQWRLKKQKLKKVRFVKTNSKKVLVKVSKNINKCIGDILYSEAADYIYASIPDLPKYFRPSALKRAGHTVTDDEEKRKGTAY